MTTCGEKFLRRELGWSISFCANRYKVEKPQQRIKRKDCVRLVGVGGRGGGGHRGLVAPVDGEGRSRNGQCGLASFSKPDLKNQVESDVRAKDIELNWVESQRGGEKRPLGPGLEGHKASFELKCQGCECYKGMCPN